MRNHWFPKGMAEYVTPSMLRSLGLNPYGGGEGLKVERDVAFVPKSQQMRRADGAEEAGRGGAAAADLSNRERRARAELAKVVVEVGVLCYKITGRLESTC